jgi:hypothetical protein
MQPIEYARFATKQEVTSFWDFVNKKRKQKDSFTNKWLSDNGDNFIKLHRTFLNDWFRFKKAEHDLRYSERIKDYDREKKRKCICMGNLKEVDMGDYQFIGCENWRERGYDHTRIYKPKYTEFVPNDLSTRYLGNLKSLYNLPKELKESNLYEYLIMMDVEPYINLDSTYKIGKDAANKSKKREAINKDILRTKFEKIYHQKGLKIKYKDGKEVLRFIDFIVMHKDNCILFEQKKTVDNINPDQINEYTNAIKWIINSSNLNYKVVHYFLIEQGEHDLEKNILTLDKLMSYDFT